MSPSLLGFRVALALGFLRLANSRCHSYSWSDTFLVLCSSLLAWSLLFFFLFILIFLPSQQAQEVMDSIKGKYNRPIATECKDATVYWPAEVWLSSFFFFAFPLGTVGVIFKTRQDKTRGIFCTNSCRWDCPPADRRLDRKLPNSYPAPPPIMFLRWPFSSPAKQHHYYL